MLNRTGGLDYRTTGVNTPFNPVIFMVDRFIDIVDLRSSDESITIGWIIEIPIPSMKFANILCHICTECIDEIVAASLKTIKVT